MLPEDASLLDQVGYWGIVTEVQMHLWRNKL